MVKKLIYVVDDDRNIRQLIGKYLENEGFRVITFPSATGVIERIKAEAPDCIVLDVMMPGDSGLDLCRKIRNEFTTPIIFVSAKGEEIDRILGIELGGDDYLVKPFSPRELVVRIKGILRRSNIQIEKEDDNTNSFGNVVIDTDARVLCVQENPMTLTNKEYELMLYLIENAQKAMSREQIIDTIWGYDYIGEMRSVDDLVRRLRKKLREGEANIVIETVWGYGYKLEKR